MIEQIASKHADFLTAAAKRLPRIAVRKVQARHLGRSVYEIEIQIENTGFLPTSLEQGQTTREVHTTRLVMELDDEAFISGSRISRLPALRGSGGMFELRLIVRAPGRRKIDFTVVSMLAGQVKGAVELPDAE